MTAILVKVSSSVLSWSHVCKKHQPHNLLIDFNKLQIPCVVYIIMLVDVDECLERLDECDQVCANIFGSYKCSCRHGWTLNSDELRCDGK